MAQEACHPHWIDRDSQNHEAGEQSDSSTESERSAVSSVGSLSSHTNGNKEFPISNTLKMKISNKIVKPKDGRSAYSWNSMALQKVYKSGKECTLYTGLKDALNLVATLLPIVTVTYQSTAHQMILAFLWENLLPALNDIAQDDPMRMSDEVERTIIQASPRWEVLKKRVIENRSQKERQRRDLYSYNPNELQRSSVQYFRSDGWPTKAVLDCATK